MSVGVFILSETGSGPVSLKMLSLTGPFQDFYQFVEDWSNVFWKLLLNGCFRILVVASIFLFSSDHILIVKYLFSSTREIVYHSSTLYLLFKAWFKWILLCMSNFSMVYQLSLEVAGSQLLNVVKCSVSEVFLTLVRCSGCLWTYFEHIWNLFLVLM